MKRIILAAALTLAAALPARAEEGIVTYKSLAPDVAFDLARAALNKCRKDGYQVAVVVRRPLRPAAGAAARSLYARAGADALPTGKAWTSVNFSKLQRSHKALIKDGMHHGRHWPVSRR